MAMANNGAFSGQNGAPFRTNRRRNRQKRKPSSLPIPENNHDEEERPSPSPKQPTPKAFRRSNSLLLTIIGLPFVLASWTSIDANIFLFVWDLWLSTIFPSSRFEAFKGKSVWVTGASSGIGAELVCHLIEAEVQQVILSARRQQDLEVVSKDCVNRFVAKKNVQPATTISYIAYDAAYPERSHKTVEHAIEANAKAGGHGIDMVILNAGIYQLQPALETDFDLAKRIVTVNYESPVALATSLIEKDKWKVRGKGHILVTASLIGRGGQSLTSTYAASKHALRGYFHSLATEESDWLRVDVVCPGGTDTNMWDSLKSNKQGGKHQKTDQKSTTDFDSTRRASVKMNPKRCAELILAGAVGPNVLFYETWITHQPGLLWVYLAAYVPDLFHLLIHIFGKARVEMWRQDGSDAINLSDFATFFWKRLQNSGSANN